MNVMRRLKSIASGRISASSDNNIGFDENKRESVVITEIEIRDDKDTEAGIINCNKTEDGQIITTRRKCLNDKKEKHPPSSSSSFESTLSSSGVISIESSIIDRLCINPNFDYCILPSLSDIPKQAKKPSSCFAMDVGGEDRSDLQEDLVVEDDSMDDLIRDRFRLTAISIAKAEAKKNGMEIGGPVVACVTDLAFKYAENVAKDLELFAHHAGCKVVNMDDVVLSAHRNDNLAASLRSLCNELKAKEPQSERKRKKTKPVVATKENERY